MPNQSQIGLYAEKLAQAYNDPTLTDAYTNYFLKNPGANPESIYDQVIARLSAFGAKLGELPTVLQEFANAAGTGVSQEAEGAATGVAQSSQTLQPGNVIADIWDKLNDRGTWIRIAEGILGITLILVALADMNKGTIKKVAKVVK